MRLVFVPERQVGKQFDISFIRAYENGIPAKIKNYLQCNLKDATEGDFVLMAGYPRRTRRHEPACYLSYIQAERMLDCMPLVRRLQVLEKRRAAGSESAEKIEEERRAVVQGLDLARADVDAVREDSDLVRRRFACDWSLRQAIFENPRLVKLYGAAWQDLEKAVDLGCDKMPAFVILERGGLLECRLFFMARELVRMAVEVEKPSQDRLLEYRGSWLEDRKKWLLADVPIDKDLEVARLAAALRMFTDKPFKTDDSSVKPITESALEILKGKKPEERAAELVRGTSLNDRKICKALLDGGRKAVEASDDPMIVLARSMDARARKARRELEKAGEMIDRARYKIACARSEVIGRPAYPDATSTLRLSFGQVTKWKDMEKSHVAARDLGKVFDSNAEDIAETTATVADSWKKRKDRLNLDTPLRLQCNLDLNYGSSGSPVLDRHFKLIGVLSDFASNSADIAYEFKALESRCMFISTAAIVEVLDKVYNASELVREWNGKK
jgi:hypothetical protein